MSETNKYVCMYVCVYVCINASAYRRLSAVADSMDTDASSGADRLVTADRLTH